MIITWLPLAPFFVLLCTIVSFKALTSPRKKTHKTSLAIRRLLKPPRTSIDVLLRARAAPNERLVHAFGITSTFVSGDPQVHRDFTGKAKDLIANFSVRGDGWKELCQIAEGAIAQFLPSQCLDYATFVQCATLTIVMVGLLNANPEAMSQEDVVLVTSTINKRWTDSKTKDADTLCQDDSLNRITDLIDNWVADHDRYPYPLNFILPAYETMWRLVAVTVAYIYRHRDNTLLNVVLEFGQNPTEIQFQTFSRDGQGPSMKTIILEALRLHPPTRHIARASEVPWWKQFFVPVLEIADVEAAHLSSTYGENTSVFDPMRFHPSKTQHQPELFAFGHGKLSCVAVSWAPMAAALIVAKVTEQLGGPRFSLTVGPRIGSRSGWDGWVVMNGSETG